MALPLWTPVPEPDSPLARYRILSPTAAVRVSPLCLGAMNIGEDNWKSVLGSLPKEDGIKLLDAFFDAGGNFIDTANNYQDETSEMVIGEWMEKRGIRDQVVIATKFSTNYKRGNDSIPIKVNYCGNSVKSLSVSVEESLKKLRTSYIDIFYMHWWDYTATVEEIMNALHNLVVSGKVLYLGVSDTPAWVVSKANQYARDHGKTPFVIYQGEWSIMKRSFERDIIPMARAEGLAIAPWGAMGGGRFRTDAEEEERKKSGEKGRMMLGPNWQRNEDERKLSAALEKVAKEVGTPYITSVALAYCMQKTPYVYPLVGGRKIEHLQANIDSLRISLTNEHIKYLESVLPFEPGFPYDLIGDGSSVGFLLSSAAFIDPQPRVEPIRPKFASKN